MRGLNAGVKELRLDKAGLEARGWTDLPKDWSPEEGELYAGGYMEDRSIYDSPVFASGDQEPRTLHLGIDVFAAAGAPVFSPLEGLVHSFQVNGGELDYGPTIILEHSPTPDLTFWTLYGHLSEDSLLGLEEGDPISAGETLAELGGPVIFPACAVYQSAQNGRRSVQILIHYWAFNSPHKKPPPGKGGGEVNRYPERGAAVESGVALV